MKMNSQYYKEQDLSSINNLQDLQKKIAALKLSIKMQELDLQERLKEIPKESMKAAAEAVLPAVVQKAVFTKSLRPFVQWGKSLLFSGKKGESDLKKPALSIAKAVGVFAGVKTLLSWIKKRKNK